MQRLAPKGAQAREALIETMGDEFATRLQDQPREKRLENDDHARRSAGPYLRDQIAREIVGPLPREVLARHGPAGSSPARLRTTG